MKESIEKLETIWRTIAYPIQVWFLHAFQRDQMGLRPTGLEDGNEATHHGDVKTDMLLFEDVPMTPEDNLASSLVYGVSPSEATLYRRNCWICTVLSTVVGVAWCSGKLVRVFHYVAPTTRNQRCQGWRT